MCLKLLYIIFLLSLSHIVSGQDDTAINRTDAQGKKTGHWVRYYPNGKIFYEGNFRDDHPVGEFRRYYENGVPKSVLVYNETGNEALATVYHPNGFVEAKGKYVNQLKEGKWQFFSISIDGYLISEEYYTSNRKNGPSLKYFPGGKIAEKLNYVNDMRSGEWIRYYPGGALLMKSYYKNDKIEGNFNAWYENGSIQITGRYRNDARDGHWKIYNQDGSVKYELDYVNGITHDIQLDIDESEYLDSIANSPVKVPDPEKTGVVK